MINNPTVQGHTRRTYWIWSL